MGRDIKKEYKKDDITIVWQPDVCIHSAICWRGEHALSTVFNPSERPWIKPEAETTERIIAQINKCPSGALSYYKSGEKENIETIAESIVEVAPNGPLLVYGNLKVKDSLGNETQKNKVTAFCRCGASSNKPYCDGTHTKINFEG